jgi:hypothetical protein
VSTAKVNEEQVALWNGVSGQAWVDAQAVIEQMFEPITQLLVAAARDEAARNVLVSAAVRAVPRVPSLACSATKAAASA